jgi:hypothetical protein
MKANTIIYDRNNFWDNTYGEFDIYEFYDNMDISEAVERASIFISDMGFDVDKAEKNYNKTKTAYFFKFEDCCFRVGSKWGQLEECFWYLNNKTRINTHAERIVFAKVKYSDLIKPELEIEEIDCLHSDYSNYVDITIRVNKGFYYSIETDKLAGDIKEFLKDNFDKIIPRTYTAERNECHEFALQEAVYFKKYLKEALENINPDVKISHGS